MSALAYTTVEESPRERQAGPRLTPELEAAVLEIAASERALDDLLTRADRLHDSNIQHDPASCLVCFGSR
ncbi:hypothetical protein ASE01_22030 [Nocardioides sp. Root190]|uniref:hypothetical protein n=1 Tax=Nocardioides sp. Root190 TaxID=1736488 RepID=UPI0006F2C859|nr:hypothetical protein [Nocardioides sp. Root190]KRB72730.1 hypothetical protein ASE01_22030 [Nocardioides sp. Root190]